MVNNPPIKRKQLIECKINQYKNEKRPVSLYLTVDVEESFNWHKSSFEHGSISDVEDIKLFHHQCVEMGVSPIYLITYRILEDSGFTQFFKLKQQLGECELGIHLHSWNTPPVSAEEPTFQCALPVSLERQKLINLADKFKSVFGYRPTIHRAGRYGIDFESYRALAELGIQVDLSPSSGFDFSEKGGPSFTHLTNNVFGLDDYPHLMCLPVPSISFLRGPDWLHRYTSVLKKYLRSQPVRLTPEGNSVDRMKRITQSLIKQGTKDIVITIHSTSFSQGANPYTQDENSNVVMINNTFEFIDWCLKSEVIKCATTQEIYNDYHSDKEVNYAGNAK